MAEPMREIQNGLHEAREKLLAVQSAVRKGRTVRVIGSLALFAIVIIYALLFISFGRSIADKDRIVAALEKEWQSPELKALISQTVTRTAQEVAPILWEQVIAQGLQKDLLREGQALVQEVWPVYRRELARVAPQILEAAQEEVGKLPVHLNALIKEQVEDRVTLAMQKNADKIRAEAGLTEEEFNRKIGVVVEAAASALEKTLSKATVMLQGNLQNWVKGHEQTLRAQTGLTEEVFTEKMADLVVAAESALVNVVKTRTDRFQGDLNEIQALLEQIPPASEKNPDVLLDKIGKVTLHLLKLNIPDYIPDSGETLEMQGGGK